MQSGCHYQCGLISSASDHVGYRQMKVVTSEVGQLRQLIRLMKGRIRVFQKVFLSVVWNSLEKLKPSLHLPLTCIFGIQIWSRWCLNMYVLYMYRFTQYRNIYKESYTKSLETHLNFFGRHTNTEDDNIQLYSEKIIVVVDLVLFFDR